VPHQDSEKDDTMIGTLVISLPSSHTGGELVVEHNGKVVACQAPPTEVSVAAFYADCRHEVKPVKTGYRVTLTCNLLVVDCDQVGDVPAEPSAEAARYLTRAFHHQGLPVERRRPGAAEPARLPPGPRVHPARTELGPAQGRRRRTGRALAGRR
jgi:2OG-Fe(II) oxygenase superfamily